MYTYVYTPAYHQCPYTGPGRLTVTDYQSHTLSVTYNQSLTISHTISHIVIDYQSLISRPT